MSISGTNEATQSVPFGTPVDTGNANAAGSAATAARSDHVHKGVVANEAWTSYTPTLGGSTLGSGTISGAYQRVGRLIVFRFSVVFGVGLSVNEPTITLPVTAAAGMSTFMDVGNATLLDATTATYKAVLRLPSTTTAGIRTIGASGIHTQITSTVPFTWVATDAIYGIGTYEAAS